MKKLFILILLINISVALSAEQADSTKLSYDELEYFAYNDYYFGKANQEFYAGYSVTLVSDHNLFQLRAFFTADELADMALIYAYSHHKKYFLLNAGVGVALTNTNFCIILCNEKGHYTPGLALYGESTLRYGIIQLGVRTDVNINAEKPMVGISLKLGFEITRIKRLIRSIF
jgi:hypothetical protein